METLPIYILYLYVYIFYILADKNVNKLNSTPFIHNKKLYVVFIFRNTYVMSIQLNLFQFKEFLPQTQHVCKANFFQHINVDKMT